MRSLAVVGLLLAAFAVPVPWLDRTGVVLVAAALLAAGVPLARRRPRPLLPFPPPPAPGLDLDDGYGDPADVLSPRSEDDLSAGVVAPTDTPGAAAPLH